MSDGAWLIFVQRPVALTLLALSAGLLVLAAIGYVSRRRDWRSKLEAP